MVGDVRCLESPPAPGFWDPPSLQLKFNSGQALTNNSNKFFGENLWLELLKSGPSLFLSTSLFDRVSIGQKGQEGFFFERKKKWAWIQTFNDTTEVELVSFVCSTGGKGCKPRLWNALYLRKALLFKFITKALFGCAGPILLGVHFRSFCMGQRNGPSATKQGLSEMEWTGAPVFGVQNYN